MKVKLTAILLSVIGVAAVVSVVTAKFGDRIPAASQPSTREVLSNPAKLTTTADSILRRDTILTTNAPVQSPQSITVTSNAIRIIDPSTQRPTAATLRSESAVSPVSMTSTSVTSTSQSSSSPTPDSLLSSSSSPQSNFHPNLNSQPQHNNPFLNNHNHNFRQPYNNHHNPHNTYNQGHQSPHHPQFRRQPPTHLSGPPPPPPSRPQHGRPPHHGHHPHGPRPNHYYAFPFGNDIPGSSSSPYASPSDIYPPGAPDFMKNLMAAFEELKSRENNRIPGGNGNGQPQAAPTAGYSSPFSSPPSSTVGPSLSPFIPPPPTPGYPQPSTEASSGPTAKASMINTFEKRTSGAHQEGNHPHPGGGNHYAPSEPDGFNFDSFFNDGSSSGFGDISGSGNSGPGGHANLNNDPLPGEFGISSGMNFYPPPPPPPPVPAVGGNNRGHNQNNNHNQGHNNQQQNPINHRGGFAHQGLINHGKVQPQQQGLHRNDLNNQASHHLQLPGQGPMSGYHGGGEQQQQNPYHPGGYGPAPQPQSSFIDNHGHNQGSHPQGGVPDPATDPRARLVKEHVGAENTEGKPYGSKMTYSFRDPAKPNNFMEVTEVRMNMNRKYDTPSVGPPVLDIPSTAGSHMDHDFSSMSPSTGSSEFFDPFRDDSAGFIDF